MQFLYVFLQTAFISLEVIIVLQLIEALIQSVLCEIMLLQTESHGFTNPESFPLASNIRHRNKAPNQPI